MTFMGLDLIFASLSFAFGFRLSYLNIVLAFVVTFFFCYALQAKIQKSENKRGIFLQSFLSFTVLFALFLRISTYFYDVSYDGQTYHQDAIIALSNGWNPYYGLLPQSFYLWVNHYAKASEILASSLYLLTGHIEQGKVFNFLFILAVFSLSFAFTLRWGKLNTLQSFFLSLILALNPVSITQSLCFYVDGQLASGITLLILSLALVFLRLEIPEIMLLFLSILFVVNLKFTGLVYALIFVAFGLFFIFLWKDALHFKKVAIISGLAFLIALAGVGFNPYITNTLTKGNPLYPLAGAQKIDILTNNTPEIDSIHFRSLNRFQQFFYATFSKSHSKLHIEEYPPKIPFGISKEELSSYGDSSLLFGGFGPFFSGLLLTSLILGTILLFTLKTAPLGWMSGGILFALMFSAFLNQGVWWARYVPQLWLIIALVPMLVYVYASQKWMHRLSHGLLLLATINLLLVLTSHYAIQSKYSQQVKSQILSLSKEKQPLKVHFNTFVSNGKRFEENGIQFIEVPKQENGRPCFTLSDTQFYVEP